MMLQHGKKCFFSALSLLLTGLLVTGLVAAASTQQAVIDERQEGFKEMGAAMKTLRDALNDDNPSAADMKAAAQNMALLAEKIPGWFPEGSGPESGLDTDARDYIWTNKEKFDRITDELITASKAMTVLTAGSDVAAIKKQLLVIRDNCSSCHDSYRVD